MGTAAPGVRLKNQSLSLRSRAASARQIEQLARKISDETNDELILEHARNAAQATIDLARVRRVKLDRYESRAAARRDKALRKIATSR